MKKLLYLIVFFAFGKMSFGQIVYVDLIPDGVTLYNSGTPYNLNVLGTDYTCVYDPVCDFRFMTPATGDSLVVAGGFSLERFYYMVGDTVKPIMPGFCSCDWDTGGCHLTSFDWTTHYYGFRIPVGGNSYKYAWIDIDLYDGVQAVIRGYAYEDIPDLGIPVGQTTGGGAVSIENEEAQVQVLVYPNPVSNYFTLESRNGSNIRSFSIIDMKGRIVQTSLVNSTQISLPRGELNSGLYMMEINMEDGELLRTKILLQ